MRPAASRSFVSVVRAMVRRVADVSPRSSAWSWMPSWVAPPMIADGRHEPGVEEAEGPVLEGRLRTRRRGVDALPVPLDLTAVRADVVRHDAELDHALPSSPSPLGTGTAV